MIKNLDRISVNFSHWLSVIQPLVDGLLEQALEGRRLYLLGLYTPDVRTCSGNAATTTLTLYGIGPKPGTWKQLYLTLGMETAAVQSKESTAFHRVSGPPARGGFPAQSTGG